MVRQEFTSSVQVLLVCLVWKLAQRMSPVTSLCWSPVAVFAHWWGGRSTTSVVAPFFGQFATVEGNQWEFTPAPLHTWSIPIFASFSPNEFIIQNRTVPYCSPGFLLNDFAMGHVEMTDKLLLAPCGFLSGCWNGLEHKFFVTSKRRKMKTTYARGSSGTFQA